MNMSPKGPVCTIKGGCYDCLLANIFEEKLFRNRKKEGREGVISAVFQYYSNLSVPTDRKEVTLPELCRILIHYFLLFNPN